MAEAKNTNRFNKLSLQRYRSCSILKRHFDASRNDKKLNTWRRLIFIHKPQVKPFNIASTLRFHSKYGMEASELYLPFWFCFYAHDNYITLEKAKLLIETEEKKGQQKKNNSKTIAKVRNEWKLIVKTRLKSVVRLRSLRRIAQSCKPENSRLSSCLTRRIILSNALSILLHNFAYGSRSEKCE